MIEAEVDRAVFDPGLLAVVQRFIPADRLHGYLHDLDRQFGELIGCSAGDATLQSQAHKIVSQAGMLGLTRMSLCAQAVENAQRSGAGHAAALLQCRAAAGDVERYAMPAAKQCPAAASTG